VLSWLVLVLVQLKKERKEKVLIQIFFLIFRRKIIYFHSIQLTLSCTVQVYIDQRHETNAGLNPSTRFAIQGTQAFKCSIRGLTYTIHKAVSPFSLVSI
jgi:hypothetical protein